MAADPRLQRASNFSGKAVADEGPKRAGAWLEAFLRAVNFWTLQAEVGRRMPAAPRVESVPRGNAVPSPGSDTPRGCHPKLSGLCVLLTRQTHDTSPRTGRMQRRVLCHPHQALTTPLVGHTGQEFCAPPTSSFCVRRSTGLLLGLQNTRLRCV